LRAIVDGDTHLPNTPNMSKKEQNTYRSAREAFDDLAVDEKARFMVEAMMSTVAEGIDRISQVIADGFDSVDAESTEEQTSGEAATGKRNRPARKGSTKTKSQSKNQSKKKQSGASTPDAA
jgi:hypothetical protein